MVRTLNFEILMRGKEVSPIARLSDFFAFLPVTRNYFISRSVDLSDK